jgi:uncharacterized protein (DUF58 family)
VETRRLLLLGGLAYALLLLGLATLDGRLLALALPLVVYLGATLVYGPQELLLSVTRTVSTDRVSPGMPVAVELSVVNAGRRLEEVLVEAPIPRGLELANGEPRVIAALPPGGTLALTYTVRGPRGKYDFPPVRVTASDHLGLFRRRKKLPARSQLIILPELPRLRRVTIRPLRTRAYAGPVPARQGGSGVEFFGVREYQPGDPRRWINWRASARHPRAIFTNEFEQERIADVGLILDARLRTNVQLGGQALFEHAVQATASLADAFLSDGNRVGLLIYGHFLDWTLPGYGKVQRERILRALAQAETGEGMIFESLDRLPTRLFPARSQVVLVSPLCNDDLPMLVRLRARGYQILVISPDPVAFEAQGLGVLEGKALRPDAPATAVDLATRIARLERVLLLRKLRQAGVQVVDWQVDKPFGQVAHAALSRAPRWFQAMGVRR